jgi:DNA-binding response OmpR family regulator
MVTNAHILIADDETTFLKATADLLRLRGYECHCVTNADEVLASLDQQPWDLLISDIRMPGNARLELVRRLQALGAGLPVILVTGYPSIESAIESLNLPVVGYLVKPFDYDQLLALVEKQVSRARVRHNLQTIRQQLGDWCADIEAAGSLVTPEGQRVSLEPVEMLVARNLGGVARTLSELGRLTHSLSLDRSQAEQWGLVASAQLDAAYRMLLESVAVLEETREAFKSKKLAQLRRKIQAVIDTWVVPRGPERMETQRTAPLANRSPLGCHRR